VRAIIQRDLDYSDQLTMIDLQAADSSTFRGRTGLNYPLFAKLGAVAIVQITMVGDDLHVALHDVGKGGVADVADHPLPSAALGRAWRLGVHQVSDQVQQWITGSPGAAATRIAYLRGLALHIVDSDGAMDIAVPTAAGGYSSEWSPDGSSLVYSTFGTSSRIMELDLATGRSRALVNAERNVTLVTPEFAPDGSHVLYTRAGEFGADIYTVDVTPNAFPRRLTVGRGTDNVNPTLSPDGRRIAFMSTRLGRPELYIMDADGTNADVLTNYDFSDNNYRSDPDWSPDGRAIAYQSRVNGRFQVYTIPVRGGSPRLLTGDGENEQPSWAPDGRHLVFTSSRSGVRQLWILDSESGRIRQLTFAAGSRLAAWSPRLGAVSARQ
jgi:TolB protein